MYGNFRKMTQTQLEPSRASLWDLRGAIPTAPDSVKSTANFSKRTKHEQCKGNMLDFFAPTCIFLLRDSANSSIFFLVSNELLLTSKEGKMLDTLTTATIIVPLKDNDGSDNSPIIERTIRTFCETHGGATAWDAQGYWVSPEGRLYEDGVKVIQSAMTKQEGNREALRELARDILADTDQEAVFISHPGGDVEIIGND
jgi:hypothetical protein